MKRFIALYFLYVGFLLSFFVLGNTYLSLIINTFQSNLTLIFLDFFLADNQLQGIDIWISSDYKIIISHACNGLLSLILFYASIWAYPSTLILKIIWMIIGYIVLFIVNVFRISWVVFVTKNGNGQEDFYWSHDIVGNIFLMLVGLGLFVTFIKANPQKIRKSKDL